MRRWLWSGFVLLLRHKVQLSVPTVDGNVVLCLYVVSDNWTHCWLVGKRLSKSYGDWHPHTKSQGGMCFTLYLVIFCRRWFVLSAKDVAFLNGAVKEKKHCLSNFSSKHTEHYVWFVNQYHLTQLYDCYDCWSDKFWQFIWIHHSGLWQLLYTRREHSPGFWPDWLSSVATGIPLWFDYRSKKYIQKKKKKVVMVDFCHSYYSLSYFYLGDNHALSSHNALGTAMDSVSCVVGYKLSLVLFVYNKLHH